MFRTRTLASYSSSSMPWQSLFGAWDNDLKVIVEPMSYIEVPTGVHLILRLFMEITKSVCLER